WPQIFWGYGLYNAAKQSIILDNEKFMFKRAPKPEGLSDLFEKNTIRKRPSDSSTGSTPPVSLSLPEPIEGAPAVKPYRRPLDPPPSPRAALLPFRLPETAPERPEGQARPAAKTESDNAP